jgi:ubiquinone/menaquinone biosynthesis C-methylase UbiE
MDTSSINVRYSALAEDSCCLSCGGASKFGKPKPGEFCVDLGSGRGTDVLRMAEEVGEKGFAIGVDVSEGMLGKARTNAVKLGITNVNFIQSDLETINLDDNIADLVISNCTLNHISDKQKVWNEVYRILKKGGRFVVSDIYATSQIPEEYKNDPVAVSECWAGSVTRDEYMKTLVNAGFDSIEVLEESEPYTKGKAEVASFTIFGMKKSKCCCS